MCAPWQALLASGWVIFLSCVCLPSLPCMGTHTHTHSVSSFCLWCVLSGTLHALEASSPPVFHHSRCFPDPPFAQAASPRQSKLMCFPQARSVSGSPGGWWEGSSGGEARVPRTAGVHIIPQRPPTHFPLNSEWKKCQMQYESYLQNRPWLASGV